MPIIDHIGIAVNDFSAAGKVLQLLRLEPAPQPEVITEQQVNTWSFRAGPSEVELLTATDAESPIAEFIKKKGAGIHHIAIRVADLAGDIARLKAEGIKMVDEVPIRGAGGKLIAFIHPKSTGGILIELTQVDS